MRLFTRGIFSFQTQKSIPSRHVSSSFVHTIFASFSKHQLATFMTVIFKNVNLLLLWFSLEHELCERKSPHTSESSLHVCICSACRYTHSPVTPVSGHGAAGFGWWKQWEQDSHLWKRGELKREGAEGGLVERDAAPSVPRKVWRNARPGFAVWKEKKKKSIPF